jgi:hypothetical protein
MTTADIDGQFHPVFFLDQYKLEDWFPPNFEVTDLGKKVFGIEPWNK